MAHIVHKVVNGETFDVGQYFEGSWKDIRILKLAAGETFDMDGTDDEFAVYLIDGDATLHIDEFGSTDQLPKGASVFSKRGTHAKVAAGTAGVRMFVLRVGV